MANKYHTLTITLLLVSLLITGPNAAQAKNSDECVILLHGLARSSSSMNHLEKALKNEGYSVQNIGYNSKQYAIEKLAKSVIPPAIEKCNTPEKIHFVTHSMGGILLRQYMSQHHINNLGKTVMLGPPNQGSEVVDKLNNFPGFSFINGKAGLQLGTGKTSVPNSLGPVNFELGIIAGSRSVNLILSQLIPGKDDGKVSVANTKVDGMNDHITLPVTHTFMMNSNVVTHQVIHYLKSGAFSRKD